MLYMCRPVRPQSKCLSTTDSPRRRAALSSGPRYCLLGRRSLTAAIRASSISPLPVPMHVPQEDSSKPMQITVVDVADGIYGYPMSRSLLDHGGLGNILRYSVILTMPIGITMPSSGMSKAFPLRPTWALCLSLMVTRCSLSRRMTWMLPPSVPRFPSPLNFCSRFNTTHACPATAACPT